MSINVRSNEAVTEPAAKPAESATLTELTDNSAPEADASEQNESESDTDETEANESEESESNDEDEKDEHKEKPGKKKGGFQRRIDKLNARVTAREQEIEYWKQQALKGAGESKKDPIETPKPASTDGKPNPDNYETHAEYVEALTDWKTEQKFKEREAKAEQSRLEAEQRKVATTYNERAKAFSEKTEDFNEVLANVEDITLSVTIRDIILSSENGPELAYELAKDRDEFARMCKLGPIAAAREIGKLEARLTTKASASKSEPKQITKAPKPLQPVNAGGKGSATKSIYDPSLSQAEYERMRMEQIKKRRQA